MSRFTGKLSFETKYRDRCLIAVTGWAPRKCIIIGETGYFADRVHEMTAHGSPDDMTGHLFTILNGDLVIEGPARAMYPTFILDYAKYHAMCKRDANVEADRLAVAAKHNEEVEAIKSASRAEVEAIKSASRIEIEKLKAAQQARLGQIEARSQMLYEKLKHAEECVSEKTLANEKLSNVLAERDSELAKKHKALRSARQQMALIMAEYNELQRESGIDAPATVAGSEIGSTTDVEALSDDSSELNDVIDPVEKPVNTVVDPPQDLDQCCADLSRLEF